MHCQPEDSLWHKTYSALLTLFTLLFSLLAHSIRAEVKQEQQRLNLLTQQLTSSTQEASELEMKVDLLKKQLAQAKETLKMKQNRIGRLQKEVGTPVHTCTYTHVRCTHRSVLVRTYVRMYMHTSTQVDTIHMLTSTSSITHASTQCTLTSYKDIT